MSHKYLRTFICNIKLLRKDENVNKTGKVFRYVNGVKEISEKKKSSGDSEWIKSSRK